VIERFFGGSGTIDPKAQLRLVALSFVEFRLHVGHLAKLQFEFAPVRASQFFDFSQSTQDVSATT
jgi:hypothetical protein